MDLDAFQGMITSLKVATDIAKSIFEIKSTTATESQNTEIRSKIIELQTALMGAQNSALSATTAQLELTEKVRKLEEQLKAANEWGGQESRYSLVCPWRSSAKVYALKESVSEGESPHFLCPNCFHRKQKAILNPMYQDGEVLSACSSCAARINTGYRGRDAGSPEYAEKYENRG